MKIPGLGNCHAVQAVILPDAPLDPVANHSMADFPRHRNSDPGPAGLPALIHQYEPRAVDRFSQGIKFQEFIPFENAVFFGEYKWLQRNGMAASGWRISYRIPAKKGFLKPLIVSGPLRACG